MLFLQITRNYIYKFSNLQNKKNNKKENKNKKKVSNFRMSFSLKVPYSKLVLHYETTILLRQLPKHFELIKC